LEQIGKPADMMVSEVKTEVMNLTCAIGMMKACHWALLYIKEKLGSGADEQKIADYVIANLDQQYGVTL
jgi:hypothetical protein